MKKTEDTENIDRKHVGRRRLIQALGVGGAGVAVSQWSKPLIDSVILPVHAQASGCGFGYVFAGSWQVDDGPDWGTNPPTYTGQEAAALLFGGSPSDYRISTVSDQVVDINDSAWLDGWGDNTTYGTSGNPAPHDFKVDDAPAGYELPGGNGSSYSAYVDDHGLALTNYAFRCAVPE